MSFTNPRGPTGGRTLGDTRSELTKRLIREGCSGSTGKLTDAQALIERLETAAQAGTSPSMRRKLLVEAAAFIRQRVVTGALLREAAE